MRKDRMVSLILLVMLLVATVTLPPGFAKYKHGSKNFGNRTAPPAAHSTIQYAPNSTIPKKPAQQSGIESLIQGSDLSSNHLLELKDGSGGVAVAVPLVDV